MPKTFAPPNAELPAFKLPKTDCPGVAPNGEAWGAVVVDADGVDAAPNLNVKGAGPVAGVLVPVEVPGVLATPKENKGLGAVVVAGVLLDVAGVVEDEVSPPPKLKVFVLFPKPDVPVALPPNTGVELVFPKTDFVGS